MADNSAGNAEYGWLGQYQRLTEREAGQPSLIEMGRMTCLPWNFVAAS